ncbi:MAG: hypothetical protein DI586_06820 [Micavibrio aeruginosavorus]|uniref:EamA domain-containing protein n=1 Tax=Micavibrio aeruginosavorus TaxID=349221 RepID=A0A2W5FM68_9BACT|nr:MAG: hypothetical protein DI586_06820 [Micavibrio aeruginosavorus]
MIKKYSLQTQGILLALFAMLTFSINDGIFKYSLRAFPLETVIFIGYFFSLLFLGAYGYWQKISFLPAQKWKGIIAGLLFLAEQTLFVYALKHLPITELFIVVLCTPVFVLIMAHIFLKEHLRRQEIHAVILGFCGALIVTCAPLATDSDSSQSNYNALAWAAAFLNVVAGGTKILFLRKYCQEENAFSLSFISILAVTVFYLMIIKSNPIDMPGFDLMLLFFGGGIGAAGCIAYIRAFQKTKAALVSATQYSQIIWAVLMGIFIFEENLNFVAICGSALILMSGYFLYLREKV